MSDVCKALWSAVNSLEKRYASEVHVPFNIYAVFWLGPKKADKNDFPGMTMPIVLFQEVNPQ